MNPESLQQLLDENSVSSVADPLAGINQLTALLPVILIASVVIMAAIGIFAVISTISRIRSQAATVAMQKDIKAIRELLETQTHAPTRQPLPQLAAQPAVSATEKSELL